MLLVFFFDTLKDLHFELHLKFTTFSSKHGRVMKKHKVPVSIIHGMFRR